MKPETRDVLSVTAALALPHLLAIGIGFYVVIRALSR